MTEPAGFPTLDEVRAWIDVPDSMISDGQLEEVLFAELEDQLHLCVWEGAEYPPGLRQALFRRCARTVAARGLPLGTLPIPMTGTGAEYGAALLPRWDPEIERYELPFRDMVVS